MIFCPVHKPVTALGENEAWKSGCGQVLTQYLLAFRGAGKIDIFVLCRILTDLDFI